MIAETGDYRRDASLIVVSNIVIFTIISARCNLALFFSFLRLLVLPGLEWVKNGSLSESKTALEREEITDLPLEAALIVGNRLKRSPREAGKGQ